MKAIKSPFVLNNFILIKQSLECISPSTKEELSFTDLFSNYPIDIDFTIQDVPNSQTNVFVKIIINNSNTKQIGYSIYIEGFGVFEFDPKTKLTVQEKSNFLLFSGLSICINSLRSIISNITAYGPFGMYTLPTIDLSALIANKKNQKTRKIK